MTERRAGSEDPLPWLLALVSTLVFLVRGFDAFLSMDVATYAYAGQLVADGRLPYEGLVNRAGPLGHWVPGLGSLLARVVGGDDLIGARVLFMAISVAAVVATYLLARDVLGSRLAGFVAGSAMLAFRFFAVYATAGPREKTLVVLLMVLAWLAAHHRRWVLAGVLTALATLTWQIAFVWLGPSIALAALLVGKDRWRAVTRFMLGGLVVLAACVLVFALPGRLDLLVEGLWTINREYVAPRIGTGREPKFWRVIENVYDWSVWLFVLGLGCTLLVALALARRDFPAGVRGRTSTLMVVVGSVCGAAWTAVVFDGNADTLPMLPGAAVMLGAAVVLLQRWWNPAGVAAATGILLACSVLAGRLLVEDPWWTLTQQRAEVAAVFDHLPPDATLLVSGAPEASVLADRRNASRFQRFSRGTWQYLGDTSPGGQQGYLDWVGSNGATVLAVRPGFVFLLMQAGGGLENYREVGRGKDWYWYLNTTTTSERTRERVKRALAAERQERRRIRQQRGAVEGSPP